MRVDFTCSCDCFRIFFRESFRHFLVHKLEVWEEGPYLTCLLIGEEGSLIPSMCLRIFPSQMKVPTITLSIFPEDSCLHIRSSAPARGSGWWRALQPLGLGPSGTLATHDAWLSPWGSVYPTPRHPISFWWPLYHIQNFAGDIMSLCHSFLPSLSLQSFSATASSSARAFLCQETHASLHFYCTFVISSERVCPARQERHHHHFCIPRSFFLALLD